MKLETFHAPGAAAKPVPGRALVPVRPSRTPVPLAEVFDRAAERSNHTRDSIGTADARAISPRQIADISMDLYVAGAVSWEEYAMLAFQPELHPDYDRTIGALTGEKAEPDRPRDYISQWQQRLKFEKKYNSDKPPLLARTQRIVDVLRQLRVRTDLSA